MSNYALSHLLFAPCSSLLISGAEVNEEDEESQSCEWPVSQLLEPAVTCPLWLTDGRSHNASLICETG